VNFVNGLGRASFHPQAFAILFNLGIGIVLGALVFSRALSWMLLRYPDLSIALLSGFMIGAIRAVWPFGMIHSNSEYFAWDAPYFWQAVCFAFFGFVLAFAMEFLAKRKKAFV
jgi:putative membrane protein